MEVYPSNSFDPIESCYKDGHSFWQADAVERRPFLRKAHYEFTLARPLEPEDLSRDPRLFRPFIGGLVEVLYDLPTFDQKDKYGLAVLQGSTSVLKRIALLKPQAK